MKKIVQVNYDALDAAKNAFIAAGKKTLGFAKKYGFVPGKSLGASANVFQLNLAPFFKSRNKELFITLLPEGLGTADDARPENLTPKEAQKFWHNIGIKTVAVMTNDAASSGMQTILIGLYLPSSTPELVFNKTFMDGFLGGFVEGCRKVGCVYFSGETPQLKNKIYPGKLDIAGALFGLVPGGKKPISSGNLKAGDTIVFVESSGPHENGFTTLRALAEKLPQKYRTKMPSGKQYWEGLNAPSVLYTPLIQDLLKSNLTITNIEPITGHGWRKLMRPSAPFKYIIEKMLPVPEIFKFVEDKLNLSPAEMIKIFNYGVGYAIFTRKKSEAKHVVALAKKHKLNAVIAGHVEKGKRREVFVKQLGVTLKDHDFSLAK